MISTLYTVHVELRSLLSSTANHNFFSISSIYGHSCACHFRRKLNTCTCTIQCMICGSSNVQSYLLFAGTLLNPISRKQWFCSLPINCVRYRYTITGGLKVDNSHYGEVQCLQLLDSISYYPISHRTRHVNGTKEYEITSLRVKEREREKYNATGYKLPL